MTFLLRQLLTAGLAANAVRPVPSYRAGFPSFIAGWLTSELAPHLLAATAADAAVHLRRRRRSSRLGLGLAALNAAALAHVAAGGLHTKDQLEDALVDGLGVDYVDQLDERPTPADLAVRLRDVARPFRFATEGIRIVRDVPYTDAGRRGILDLYLPDGSAGEVTGAPVLLQVHGGAWMVGKKEEQGQPLMRHLAAKGWVCVAINYRLAPRDPFPAQVIDVKRAIAWVREHIEEFGGDPGYVAITGGSAGGHLTALAAVTPNDPAYQPGFEDADTSVAAAIPHYGVYDFAGSTGLRGAELMRDTFLAPRIVQKRWADDPEVFEAGSPLLRVGPDAPDFFVLHGTHDSLVSVEQARLFVERLREVSDATVVYAELPGAQHAFDTFHSFRSAHVVKAIDRYLHWHWNTWRSRQGVTRRSTGAH